MLSQDKPDEFDDAARELLPCRYGPQSPISARPRLCFEEEQVHAAACPAWWRSAVAQSLRDTAAHEGFDLIQHIHRQRRFSTQTFGPGLRTNGVIDHIRKELNEVEASPTDLIEWVDVILLAIDGAWRAGHEPEAIADAIEAKLTINEKREYPDWRTVPADKAIEHIRALAPDVKEQL